MATLTQGQKDRIADAKARRDAALERFLTAKSAEATLRQAKQRLTLAIATRDRVIEQDRPPERIQEARTAVDAARLIVQAARTEYQGLPKNRSVTEQELARTRLALAERRQIEQSKARERELTAAIAILSRSDRIAAIVAAYAVDLSAPDADEATREEMAVSLGKQGIKTKELRAMDAKLVEEEDMDDE